MSSESRVLTATPMSAMLRGEEGWRRGDGEEEMRMCGG